MKVFLVGYMGVGKSTIGKRLGQVLDLPFRDLDHLVESLTEKPISEIFASEGEESFRRKEAEVLETLATNAEDFVLATGGGVGAQPQLMRLMKSSGLVIWLNMPVTAIVNRLEHARESRPLVENKSGEELAEFVKEHLSEREPIYKKAHMEVSAINLKGARVEELAMQIRNFYTK